MKDFSKKVIAPTLFFTSLLISTTLKAASDNSDLYFQQQANKCEQFEEKQDLLEKSPGIYYFALGVCKYGYIHDEKSFNETVSLFKKSAITNELAHFALGILYEYKYRLGSLFYGVKGEPNDILESIKNYEQSSKFGSALAQNNLGIIYLDFANIPDTEKDKPGKLKDVKNEDAPIQLPDINKAILWFTKSAQNGNAAAQGALSDLYAQGIGVPQNYIMAYVWQNLSMASQLRYNKNMQQSETGKLLAQLGLKTRDKLYNLLTSEQKNEAHKLLSDYAAIYFHEPNKIDKKAWDLQGYFLSINAMKLEHQVKKLLEG